MSHPRDPRLRRHRDPLDGAVRLELGMDAMRSQLTATGPEREQLEAIAADVGQPAADPVDVLAADAVAAAQLHTTAGEFTAQDFADAIAVDHDDDEPPAPEPVTPDPAPAPPAEDRPWRFPAESIYPARQTGKRSDSNAPDPRLTWRSRHDEASRRYSIRAALRGSTPLQNITLEVGPVLDQGEEGACVGCAVAAAGNVLELLPPDDPAARWSDDGILADFAAATAIYERAQELDEVPGEDYAGTSVLAGMKAGVEAGLFGGYRWAFGTRDIAQTLLRRLPVVVGVPWSAGMYETGPGGLVEVTGDPVGGHALAVVGLRLKGPQGQSGPFFVWQNSWGTGYGDGGLGYVHHKLLAGLLAGQGEASVPMAAPQEPAP